jgi:hypothetical protein
MNILKSIDINKRECMSAKCKSAKRAGRHVHLIPNITGGTLVLPTYHFASVDAGKREIQRMFSNAIVITTDAQLFEARAKKTPHILPNGWIDPTRR